MVSRGEIYLVEFGSTDRRGENVGRPVLIVSSNAVNNLPLVLTVVVGTTGEEIGKDYPGSVRAAPYETGLSEETVFLCFQIRSIDPSRLMDPSTGRTVPAGVMSAQKMAQVDEALRFVLDL
jgi:mRNA interferase MazF